MAAYLSYLDGNDERRIPCGALLTIGRERGNDIVVEDKLTSRRHAVVRRLGPSDYYFMDIGSSNGSFLNRRRISVATQVRDGDVLQVGSLSLTFHQDDQEETVATDTVELERTTLVQTTEVRQITILVADIRGYTQLSESVPIGTLTRLMSNWFREVSDCIEGHQGTVDKFIGDCVYARWETEDLPAATVYRALAAATDIAGITTRLGRGFPGIGDGLRVGAGIHTGRAAMGIGRDATALGDAVNLAFRLESATKELNTDVVISESSYGHLPARFFSGRERTISVKGRNDPVTVCALDLELARSISSEAG